MDQTLTDQQLNEIAEKFGTPVYVYHAECIAEQYQKLKKGFAGTDARFFYACKALTNIHVLRCIKALGAGADCSSINEVKIALLAGFAPQEILYTSNGIAFSEIEEAVDLGVHVNIDSLSNLEKFGKKYGHSYPLGLRLRPNILAGGNIKISTGHESSKFGIPVEQADAVVDLINRYDIWVNCLHIHTGSEIKDVDVFIEGMEVLFKLLPLFRELQFIDLGGGFKVPYKDGDSATDIDLLGEEVGIAFGQMNSFYGRPLQPWFEPGKFLVSSCGYLITSVNVVKETPSITFAGVNSGFNHLIRPMFYDSYHHIKNISNPGGAQRTYNVVGNICETDTFATNRQLNEIREGDHLVFFNAGAYGFEMSSNFNSRLKPGEVLVENGVPRLIRRRDEFNDLLRNIEGGF
jgi:diaminopimelate decarboxylase